MTRLLNALRRERLTGLPQAASRFFRGRSALARARSVIAQTEEVASKTSLRPRVECPVCGWTGQVFHPILFYGMVHFNSCCPDCGSLPRHRLIRDVLDDLSFEQWEGRLLHFAPEEHLSRVFEQIRGIDHFTVDLLQENTDCWLDVQALPFGDSSFDYVCCSHVLEHVPDDRRALAELTRVLRPGGFAVVCVPHDPDSPNTVEFGAVKHHGHLRCYGKDLAERVNESTAVQDCSTDTRPTGEALKHGLSRRDMLLVLSRNESGQTAQY